MNNFNIKIEKVTVVAKHALHKNFCQPMSYHICSKHYTHIMTMIPTIATCPYCDGTEEYIPQRFHGIDTSEGNENDR